MTSPSKGAPIYHMTARVAFKKQKVVHERVVWMVSVFDNPVDIMKYDAKTMRRLKSELYPINSKTPKTVMVREILSKNYISDSNLTIQEHRHQHESQHIQGHL